MVKKKSAAKVKETLDITDELIAERRTSLKMPKDMVPWMAKTIEFIDAKMLLTGKIICWICVPLIFSMVYEVIGRHFFNRPTLWVYDVTRMSAGAFFMLGAAYTLSKGIHIRADFLYRNWKIRNQAKVDLFLYLLFFFPGFLVFFWVSFDYAYTSICGRSELMECIGGKMRIQRAMGYNLDAYNVASKKLHAYRGIFAISSRFFRSFKKLLRICER